MRDVQPHLGRVQVYPAPPGAEAGLAHSVRVDGTPVFVERYEDVSYARFAVRGPVTVEIEVAASVARHVVFPRERVGEPRVSGRVLSFELPAPRSIVVWIDDLEKLVLLPDPPEDDAVLPGARGVFDVSVFGVDPGGAAVQTAALQAVIDRAARHPGGGIVLVPAGGFRTGTLSLPSHVRLHIAAGALLAGSDDPGDYPLDPGRRESAGDETLAPDARFLGRTMTFSRLLLVDLAEGVRITGRGTIDGAGSVLRKVHGAAPNLLRVRSSRDVAVRDVLFRNSAAWSLHVLASRDVTFDNVKLLNDRTNLNTDGIDPDMSTDVRIERCFVYTKDDAICVKASGNGGLTGDPARIVARGNLLSSVDAALKVGTESAAATFSDIRFEDNHVFETGRAMSVVVRDGATYDGITFSGVDIGPGVEHLVEQVIGVRDPAADLGVVRNLVFKDVSAPSYGPPATNWTWYAQFRPSRPGPEERVKVFEGADETHGVEGLTLRNVVVNGAHLRDAATAADVAGLAIGEHVRNPSG